MSFSDVILTDTPEDKSVTVGDSVTFTCTAVSFLFQPEFHWILDNERFADCFNEAVYCIENTFLSELQTRSTFTFTAANITNHSVTCIVSQRAEVTSTATLTVWAEGDTLYVFMYIRIMCM